MYTFVAHCIFNLPIPKSNSLGGALASMSAFKLAGMAEDWIPKPISCVTFASPIIGTDQFGAAFEVCMNYMIGFVHYKNSV